MNEYWNMKNNASKTEPEPCNYVKTHGHVSLHKTSNLQL